MTIDIRKAARSIEQLKKLSPYYDNVIEAIVRELKERYVYLVDLTEYVVYSKVDNEMNAIKRWLEENDEL